MHNVFFLYIAFVFSKTSVSKKVHVNIIILLSLSVLIYSTIFDQIYLNSVKI